jgi:hypothetical protein
VFAGSAGLGILIDGAEVVSMWHRDCQVVPPGVVKRLFLDGRVQTIWSAIDLRPFVHPIETDQQALQYSRLVRGLGLPDATHAGEILLGLDASELPVGYFGRKDAERWGIGLEPEFSRGPKGEIRMRRPSFFDDRDTPGDFGRLALIEEEILRDGTYRVREVRPIDEPEPDRFVFSPGMESCSLPPVLPR